MAARTLTMVCIAAALAGCTATSYEAATSYGPPQGEVDGPSPDALASQGYDAYNFGDYAGAIAYFEEALALDPKNAFALRGLDASRDGVVYFGDRRPTKRDTRAAIRRVSLEGYEAYARGDLAGAGARFRAVLAVEPGNAYALDGLEAIRRKAATLRPIEGAAATTAAVAPVGSYDVYDAPDAVVVVPSDRSPKRR